MEFILLVVGFACLIKGADIFVEGSSSLAKILKVPTVIIGLTIVAMGTSAPEASVSLNAAFAGNNDIAISNVVGSNIFNILIVVGICAFLKSFDVNQDILKRDLPINIIISIILCLMIIDGKLSQLDGLILLIGMVTYIIVMIRIALKNRVEEEVETHSLFKSAIYIILGLIAVIIGGDLVVDCASKIALMFGFSQNFVGLTIVAIGTSLPELVTSVVATRKGESALALGNAVGSNIFNILFILGMSATLSPLTVLSESIIDCLIMLFVAVTLYFFAKRNGKMDKKEGVIFVLMYIIYTIYLFIR